jgi:hypothetical protein
MSATIGAGEPPAEPRLYVYARRNRSRWHIIPAGPAERSPSLCGLLMLWTERRDQVPPEEFESVCLRCHDHIWRGKVFELRGALWGPGEVGR